MYSALRWGAVYALAEFLEGWLARGSGIIDFMILELCHTNDL